MHGCATDSHCCEDANVDMGMFAGSITRRFSGTSEAFKSPTSVSAITGALFGRASNTGAGTVQLPLSRSLRPIPEDQV